MINLEKFGLDDEALGKIGNLAPDTSYH